MFHVKPFGSLVPTRFAGGESLSVRLRDLYLSIKTHLPPFVLRRAEGSSRPLRVPIPGGAPLVPRAYGGER